MKIKIAVFCSGSYKCAFAFEPDPNTWTQLTEFTEVNLPDLPKQSIIDSQVEIIDKQIEEENGKHYAEIKRLEQKKQELLAITYESEAKQGYEEPTTAEMKHDYEDAN